MNGESDGRTHLCALYSCSRLMILAELTESTFLDAAPLWLLRWLEVRVVVDTTEGDIEDENRVEDRVEDGGERQEPF